MAEPDLNELRRVILDAQRQNRSKTLDKAEQPMVTPEGKVVLRKDLNDAAQPATEIPLTVFATPPATNRYAKEYAVATKFMPPNTQYLEVDGVSGWLYSIVSELGTHYEFFAFHANGVYKVKVVAPTVELQNRNVHTTHLFPDGTICIDPDTTRLGMERLQEAYAKSVLWALGFDTYRETGAFQFSANNVG